MTASVAETCKNIISFVETAVSPTTTQADRNKAYNAFEDFKENSPQCAQCGVLLSAKNNSPVIRHIGLQLVEHCIKLRWNVMTPEEKLSIKETATRLVAEGTQNLLVEHTHIKDAVSRIVVEMVKREWPQQWPTFLQELHQLSSLGETQTELVLLIFLRLAEDVVAFQTVQNQRRREIHQALVANLSEISQFFLTTLNLHYTKYTEMKNAADEGQRTQSEIHRRVTESTLKTLSGFVEWIPVKFIMENDRLLPKIFCYLLSDIDLRTHAAECLLQVVSRKGNNLEKHHLVSLFNQDMMSAVLSASNSASTEAFDEKSYTFLKALCNIIANLGFLLSACWGSDNNDVKMPPTELFDVYLDALLATIKHPSHAMNRITLPVWSSFFKHKEISELDAVKNAIPKLLKLATEKFVKAGYPSKNDHPSCAYSRLDCDSDEEFNTLFSAFRRDLSDMVKSATLLNPIAGFQMACQWLQTLMATKIDVGDASENGICASTSPSAVWWEALVQFMDGVFGKMLTSPHPKPSVEEGIYLLEDVLRFNPPDPTIQSYALSCISSLCIFLTLAPGSLPLVLDKIFFCAVYKMQGETTGKVQSRASRMLRRHAVAALVALSRLYPKVLMPCFEQIYATTKRLAEETNEMSHMERITATEAMIILSNERKDYKCQADFIVEVETPLVSVLSTPELEHALSSPEAFMSFVGMTEYPRDEAQDEEQGSRRSQLLRCSSTLVALIKHSWAPDNMEEASKGGFFVAEGPGGKPYCRNPATPFLANVLPKLCQLMHMYNALWTEEARSKVHSAFVTVYEMQEGEKNLVLGSLTRSEPSTDILGQKQPLDKLKSFMVTFQEQCLHIFGNSGEYLGPEFYLIEGLSEMLVKSVLSNLDQLPAYRLCPVIRSFVRPFVQHCPQELRMKVALPVLSAVLPFMYQKLNAKWETFQLKYGAYAAYEDEMTEEQEVLEDQLTRWITRHYVDLVGAVLMNRRGQEPTLDSLEQDQESSPPVIQNSASISEFGANILRIDSLCPFVVMSVFSALHWHDTVACMKALTLAPPLLKQMLQDNIIRDEGGAGYILHNILKGLQMHGEHDLHQALLVSLAMLAYDSFKRTFPGVINIMLTIPGCTTQELESFEARLQPSPTGKMIPEKKKKEWFRKLISPVIGRNIGQQFKASIEILNLPPIFSARRMAVDDQDPAANVDSIVTLFADREA
ncbi:exportin-5-like [Ornithodoros turicata]|uniref:exportin-5-like n=1 Tax=Ornithodoros turicata TaxID=34597 RepID=UPI00313A16D6